MKTTIKPIFQYIFAAVLLLSWIDYQSIVSDRPAFGDVSRKDGYYSKCSMSMIKSSTDKLIYSGESLADRYGEKQKLIVEKMKEVDDIIDELYDEISMTQSGFYKLEEIKWDWKREKEPKMPLPINYNKEADVIDIFKEYEQATKLSWSIEKSLNELEKVCKVKKHHAFFGFKKLKTYNEKQAEVFSSEKNIIAYILDTKQFKKDIVQYDVVHAKALMNALMYQIGLLHHELTKNMYDLMVKRNNIKIEHMLVFEAKQPMTSTEQELYIFPTTYINSPEIDITLNGRKLEVQDGVATFNYTPKTAGDKYFQVKVGVKNPFTGKTDNFGKNFKHYAVE